MDGCLPWPLGFPVWRGTAKGQPAWGPVKYGVQDGIPPAEV